MRGKLGRGRGSPVRLAVITGLAGFWIALVPEPAKSQFQGLPNLDGPGRAASSFHPDASYTAESLLRNAANHVRDGQWSEAISLYERVIKEHGETVALVPRNDQAADPAAGLSLYVNARRHCQQRIAALPDEALALYQRRVDAQTERLYREATEQGDRAKLRQVVEEFFCSSWGDDAAERLGDLAFREGRFGEALGAYRLLVPDRDEDPTGLIHPEPSVDLARVAAKKLLARAAIGESDVSDQGLAAFRAKYPEAKGHLAGRDGKLAESLAAALAQDALAPSAETDERWPTFAGAPSRSRVAPQAVDIGDFQWKIRLQDPNSDRRFASAARIRAGFGRIDASTSDRDLAYYPIILGDQVIVCDDSEIAAYRLNQRPETGLDESARLERLLVWKSRLPSGGAAPRAARGGLDSPSRFTLTAFGDRIYARLNAGGSGRGGVIVALENSREVEGKLKWIKTAAEIDLPTRRGGPAERFPPTFEGTPVADGRHVYVALTEAATETWVYVACLDAETKETVWVQYLGNASSAFDMMRNQQLGTEVGQRLLTLDGQTVYYQTNMGALAALDAETGAIRWLSTYPTRDPGGRGFGAPVSRRDLNPALVSDGLVIVAPEDASEILAFDAATGRLVWKSPPIPEIVHLLGCAGGKLFATGDHVFSFDVRTGALLRTWPEVGKFEGYGRGLLAGDKIYWPNKTEIHVLDQATGGNVHETIPLSQAFNKLGGNLAVGDGFLVVASRDELTVYCQNSRLIERYQQLVANEPEKASHHYQLARLAETTGQDALALASLRDAARLAGPSDRVDGRPLVEVALEREHQLLMRLGTEASEAKDWETARDRLTRAVATARTDRERLRARLAVAGSLAGSGSPQEAAASLQDLLGEPWIESLAVATDEHRTVRADLLIADRLATLIREHGREVYAPYDQAARDLLKRGETEQDPKLLREIGRSYPLAEVAPEALLALGRLGHERKEPAEAASAYKRLLAIAPDEPIRARALWGLAESYESQGYLAPARDFFARARSRYPDVDLTPFGVNGRVGPLATERLARPEYEALGGGHAEPSLPVPLVRRWSRRLDSEARPLSAEGQPPSDRTGRLFLAEGHRLRSLDPSSGEPGWTATLDGDPNWIGYLGDHVLAATSRRVVAIGAADGKTSWVFDPADPRGEFSTLNPFARPDLIGGTPADRDPAPIGRLHGFRLVGSRLLLLRGDGELLALDAETGRLDWSYAPGSGAINPNPLVTPSRVVLEAGPSHDLIVLDTENGRLRGAFPRGQAAEPWARSPLPIDDDRVVLTIDARTVSLFDLARGVPVWSFEDHSALPRGVAPRLFVDSGRLLVLFGGDTLTRLDPNTGEALWEQPLGLGDLSPWPDSFAIDGPRVYVASGSLAHGAPPTLSAYHLEDGRRLWSRALIGPRTGWSLALRERGVVAYPDPSRSLEGPLKALPILVCQGETGLPVQRLVFPETVRRLAIDLGDRSVLIATQDRVWALGASTNTLADRGPENR